MTDSRRGARGVACVAVMAALLLAVQVALAPLPNIELVSVILAACTAVMPRKSLAALYIFVLLEGLIYGFGLWWVNYLYVWLALWGAAVLARRCDGAVFWAALLGGFGLFFGTLCAAVYLVMFGPASAVAYVAAGIPFDLAHCAGNFCSGLLLFKPLRAALQKAAASFDFAEKPLGQRGGIPAKN